MAGAERCAPVHGCGPGALSLSAGPREADERASGDGGRPGHETASHSKEARTNRRKLFLPEGELFEARTNRRKLFLPAGELFAGPEVQEQGKQRNG